MTEIGRSLPRPLGALLSRAKLDRPRLAALPRGLAGRAEPHRPRPEPPRADASTSSVLWLARRIALASTGCGISLVALGAYLRAEAPLPSEHDGLVLRAYTLLPWRALSRLAGWVHDRRLPDWARVPVLSAYARVLNIQMDDAWPARLDAYESVGALFARRLRPDARPVDRAAALVSPVDGVVVACGRVRESTSTPAAVDELAAAAGRLGAPPTALAVKGIAYRLGALLGGGSAHRGRPLHQVTIYLGPGDYHGFHAPTELVLSRAAHVSGALLSVRPSLLGRWPILGSNERVALSGAWDRGFFALVAVGATGVGSIELDAAPELRTNVPRAQSGDITALEFAAGRVVRRGERLGGFRLGSCVVLLFESADDVPFAVAPGQAVRVGEPLVGGGGAAAVDAAAVVARRSAAP